MDENLTKTTIRLLGNEYTITSTDSEEYVHRVAFYVDKMLTDIYSRNSRLSTNMAAVLASVNIADDLFKLRDELDKIKTECEDISAEISDKDNQIVNLKRDNDLLHQEIQRLKIEIAKLEVRR